MMAVFAYVLAALTITGVHQLVIVVREECRPEHSIPCGIVGIIATVIGVIGGLEFAPWSVLTGLAILALYYIAIAAPPKQPPNWAP
jgi:hypothetical protein